MKLALVVSRLFDPIIVLSLVAITAAARSNMGGEALFRFIIVLFLGMVVPPVALLLWAIQKHRISNWDMSNRRQRVSALIVFACFLIVDLLLVRVFGNAYLSKLFLAFFVWFIGFLVITLFWKISGHVSSITLACLLGIYWFGWMAWPILFLIPLVSWARITSKNHSVAQTIAGVLYALVIIRFLP